MKLTNIAPKRKKNTKRKKLIWYSICGGAEKEKHSAKTDKIGAKNDQMEVTKKSAETGGHWINGWKHKELKWVILEWKFV